MKLAAQQLDALPQAGRDFLYSRALMRMDDVERLPEVSPDDLRTAWLDILQRARLVVIR